MKTIFKKNGGFTLVELIVVIAILAILAGVAVPAYSGYIEKANKQADMTLISDIEQALMLAGYSGTFSEGEGGYIILSAESEVEGVAAGSALEKALTDTFGVGYADTLKLKYDNWDSNGLYNNLNPESAFAVKQSNYMKGTRSDKLLSDVETMTSMAYNLVTVLSDNSFSEGTTLSELFTNPDGTCVLDETAAKYGITKKENETWEQWAAGNNGANQNAYSNLLVLAAADESERFMSTMGQNDQYNMSEASAMILEFSTFYAYAAQNSDFSATLDNYMAHLNGTGEVDGLSSVTDVGTGAAWYNSLKAQAGEGYNSYLATAEQDNGQARLDQVGFLSIMAGLGNPSKEQAAQVAADLNNANLFTSGVVNGMYNDYLDGVDALSGMYDEDYEDYATWNLGLGDGTVAVLYTIKNGQIVIVDSLPAA